MSINCDRAALCSLFNIDHIIEAYQHVILTSGLSFQDLAKLELHID